MLVSELLLICEPTTSIATIWHSTLDYPTLGHSNIARDMPPVELQFDSMLGGKKDLESNKGSIWYSSGHEVREVMLKRV